MIKNFVISVLVTVLVITISGQTLCKIGEELCDGTCFKPERLKCIKIIGNTTGRGYTPVTIKLCRHEESLCAREGHSGHWAHCYDPTFEECHVVRSDAKVCPKGSKLCGTHSAACFNPELQDCLKDEESNNNSSQEVLCHKGQKVCGSSCYWPGFYNCLRPKK
ncbi:uncharacterized protein LOC110863207 [Folsomia candida]|uniref:uncharacterized protein LOC110863207 n=1 Tax=Folsomia candida TaxID=158441 RepID=UPI000B900F73|nr:uncharacterized protein LOC110863207 [Folsomia candida]